MGLPIDGLGVEQPRVGASQGDGDWGGSLWPRCGSTGWRGVGATATWPWGTVSAPVDVRSRASDCSGGTPPFSSRLFSLLRETRSRFPLPTTLNPENIDEIMLRFEGREEDLLKALCLMRSKNTVQQRAQAAVWRTTSLEAGAR